MTLITRIGKGSKLTTAEMDGNLTYLESEAQKYWEADGETGIKPKDSKKIDASNIDGLDHTKFEFFNDCDIIRENRVIILDRLNFFLDYIGSKTVTEVKGYKII